MYIKKLDKLSSPEYTELASAKGSIFNSSEWLSLYKSNLQIFGIYNNDHQLIGGFNLYFTSLGIFKYIKTPPFTPHIALFIQENVSNPAKRLSFFKNLMELIAIYIKKLPYQIVSIAFPPEFNDFQPFIWKNFKVVPNYTYQYDLNNTLELLTKQMATERRNDIKKAEKDKLTIIHNAKNQTVCKLVLNTFSKKNKTIDTQFIQKIITMFNNSEHGYSFTTFLNDMPLATSFCIHDNKTAYYLLGGYDSNSKHQGAGAIAVWECIKHAKKLGLVSFDFEGSMLPPVEKYFRGFGATLTPYFFAHRAAIPIEVVLKIFKRSVF